MWTGYSAVKEVSFITFISCKTQTLPAFIAEMLIYKFSIFTIVSYTNLVIWALAYGLISNKIMHHYSIILPLGISKMYFVRKSLQPRRQ